MLRCSIVAAAMLIVASFSLGSSDVRADPLSIPIYKKRVLPPNPCMGAACSRPVAKRKPNPLPPSPCKDGFCASR